MAYVPQGCSIEVNALPLSWWQLTFGAVILVQREVCQSQSRSCVRTQPRAPTGGHYARPRWKCDRQRTHPDRSAGADELRAAVSRC